MSIPTTIRKHPTFHRDDLLEVMRQQLVALQTYQANQCVTAPALVIGTNSSADIRLNVATTYVRDGIQRSRAVAEVDVPPGAAMAGDGIARKVRVLVYINPSDNLAAVASPVVRSSEPLETPTLPAGGVQLGYVDIASTGASVYTPDTTLLSAGHLTVTYVNAPVPEQNWAIPARLGNT